MRWATDPGLAPPPGLFGSDGEVDTAALERERKRAEDYLHRQAAIEQEARLATLRFAAIFCTCPRRYRPDKSPYGKCQIHGQFMITPDGRVL